jgi:hypothetical protein
MGSRDGIEGGVVGELLDLGLVERVAQLAVGGDRGVVEDRSGRSRDTDPARGPQARTAASQRPSRVRWGWPTAYTPA